MPVFEYECTDCGEKYEIFHFTKEINEDIICPKCNSLEHKKFLSGFSAKVKPSTSHHPHHSHQTPSPCSSCCNSPSCGLNYN